MAETQDQTFRARLQSRPQLAIGVAVSLLIVATALWWAMGPPTGADRLAMPSKLYFSDDDGKSFFADDSARIAPFDHNGRAAYQAAVFKCGGSQPFVGYLIKFTSVGQAAMAAIPEAERRTASPRVIDVRTGATVVKRPGEKRWVSLAAGDTPAGQILNPPCQSGSSDRPEQITP